MLKYTLFKKCVRSLSEFTSVQLRPTTVSNRAIDVSKKVIWDLFYGSADLHICRWNTIFSFAKIYQMDNFYENSHGEQNVLTEFEVNLVQANAGKRFANYIIDFIIWCLLILISTVIYYLIVGLPERDDSNDSPFGSPLERIVFALIYAVCMGLIEWIFKGKTLGKLITGTRAVNIDGTRMSFKTAFLRGFSRIVPFEPFSAFGSPCYPLHDKWTNTYVVDEKVSTLPLNS